MINVVLFALLRSRWWHGWLVAGSFAGATAGSSACVHAGATAGSSAVPSAGSFTGAIADSRNEHAVAGEALAGTGRIDVVCHTNQKIKTRGCFCRGAIPKAGIFGRCAGKSRGLREKYGCGLPPRLQGPRRLRRPSGGQRLFRTPATAFLRLT